MKQNLHRDSEHLPHDNTHTLLTRASVGVYSASTRGSEGEFVTCHNVMFPSARPPSVGNELMARDCEERNTRQFTVPAVAETNSRHKPRARNAAGTLVPYANEARKKIWKTRRDRQSLQRGTCGIALVGYFYGVRRMEKRRRI